MAKVHCDQCHALVINGHPSHEFGCPNRDKPWVIEGERLTTPGYKTDVDLSVFPTYEAFCNWCYDPDTQNKDSTWPRTKFKGKILIKSENIMYNSSMQVLHSHEEG